jgi:hypothetical protein
MCMHGQLIEMLRQFNHARELSEYWIHRLQVLQAAGRPQRGEGGSSLK